MLSGFEIKCANKNQLGRIVRLGGLDWSMSQQEVVHKILGNQLRFFIQVGDESFELAVRSEGDDTYLVLEADGKALDEIEGLMSC